MKTIDILSKSRAIDLGYSPDRRVRRRQHRKAAKNLMGNGGFFNNFSAPGSSFWQLAQWHLHQARYL